MQRRGFPKGFFGFSLSHATTHSMNWSPVDGDFPDYVGEFKLDSTFCESSLALTAAVLFCFLTVELFYTLRKSDSGVGQVWTIPRPCVSFQAKFDALQEQLEALSVMDELLSGLLKQLICN